MRSSRRPYRHPRFGECVSSSPYSMPQIFQELAAYNRRVTQGIVHTPAYQAMMAELQCKFDEWSAETRERL